MLFCPSSFAKHNLSEGTMSTAPVSAQDQSIINQILALEKRRWEFIVADNIDEYEKMLADDLLYIHTTGRMDTKEGLLSLRRKTKNRFVSFEQTDLCVRVPNSLTGILTGRIRNLQKVDGGEKTAHNRFTSVWTRKTNESNEWRFTSYQQTAIVPGYE
jgi:hypothetical protein